MRVPYFSLLALLGLYVLWGPGMPDAKVPELAKSVIGEASTVSDVASAASAASNLPDPHLTPGAVLTADVAKICTPGFARELRRTSRALKLAVYAAYHVAPNSAHYEIDHLIPLELGGADVAANLWPESYDLKRGNAHAKDQLENFLHREVCAGKISLPAAQAAIAKDWHAAYRKYIGQSK